jgi:hypothetical protein
MYILILHHIGYFQTGFGLSEKAITFEADGNWNFGKDRHGHVKMLLE